MSKTVLTYIAMVTLNSWKNENYHNRCLKNEVKCYFYSNKQDLLNSCSVFENPIYQY